MVDINALFRTIRNLVTGGPRVPVFATYLFTWYEEPLSDKQLILTPPRPYNCSDPAWQAQQFADMERAGIDFCLQDVPIGHTQPNLAVAAQNSKVKVGLFLDTNKEFFPLSRANLAKQENKDWFIDQVIAWYGNMPKSTWATIQGRPIVMLYTASFYPATQFDPLFSLLKLRFWRNFAVVPWLIAGDGWGGRAHPLKIPDGYSGYSLSGVTFSRDGGIFHAGPGFDDGNPALRTPRSLDKYTQLLMAMQPHASFMMIESWNELYENSGIAQMTNYDKSPYEFIDATMSAKQQLIQKWAGG